MDMDTYINSVTIRSSYVTRMLDTCLIPRRHQNIYDVVEGLGAPSQKTSLLGGVA